MKAAKHRRGAVKEAKLTPIKKARQHLRLFAKFIETQNAEALAAQVTNFRKTLYHCARIQLFFQRYAAALRARRLQ